MSQFDFPRIHFSGSAAIDVATGNNNYHFPLVTFDPDQVQAVLPPRIVLGERNLDKIKSRGALAFLLDEVIAGKDGPYLEISPIDHPRLFKEWCATPLGTHPADARYHPLYKILLTEKEQEPLAGKCPGFWNYYGRMTFELEQVSVGRVDVFEKGKRSYDRHSPDCPAGVVEVLGAELTFKNERGRGGAVMIDVSPTLSVYSQVFADQLRLHKSGQHWLQGRPTKASVRFMNPHRVLNQPGILGSSGSFVCSIPLEDMEQPSSLIRLFKKYGQTERKLLGVSITYDLCEVSEDQNPDFQRLGSNSNPARATITGMLCPWYQGELRSAHTGRLLLPKEEIRRRKTLPASLCRVNPELSLISLDLLGAIPQTNLSLKQGHQAQHATPQSYETFDLGHLQLRLVHESGTVSVLGEMTIDEKNHPRHHHLNGGGIFDFPLRQPHHDLASGTLQLCQIPGPGTKEKVLLEETPYLITTDQTGIYANQSADPGQVYRSYGAQLEPCEIRVFHKGKPLGNTLEMQVLQGRLTQFGSTLERTEFARISEFRDGQVMHFPLDRAGNYLYAFHPVELGPPPQNLLHTFLRTGAFVNLRVLPARDFGKYLDPGHPDYPTPIPFELIYQEILAYSDLIYPASGLITPFNETYFRKIRRYLRQLIDDRAWNTFLYMPSSRDMSNDRRRLLVAYLEQLEDE